MKFWNSNLKNLYPYLPGEQPKTDDQFIKLNTNENPYPPSPKVIKKLQELNPQNLAQYSDPNWSRLREALAVRYNIAKEQLFCGNGSDEILSLIFRAFLSSEDQIIIPYPNYSLYETLAQSYGISYLSIQSNDQFIISFDSLSQIQSKAIFFSNPNAPTGRYYDINLISDFCKTYNGLFILDEAYIDFGGKSGIKLISQLDNLLITRTFSKSFSLAGLRFGYAFGSPSLVEGLMRIKDSYNLNTITQLLAYEAIQDYDTMRENVQKVMLNRDYLTNELKKLGFNVIPSKGNFVFVSHPNYPANQLFNTLKKKKILVRYFDRPRIKDYLRITIGNKANLDKLIKTIGSIIF